MVLATAPPLAYVSPPVSPRLNWAHGNDTLYPSPYGAKTPPVRQRLAAQPQGTHPSRLVTPSRTSITIQRPERIPRPITEPLTARTIAPHPTSSADDDGGSLRPLSRMAYLDGASSSWASSARWASAEGMFVPAITLAEASVLPPPRTYSSTGSALVPDQLSFSPLTPTRQLVAEVKQWKDSYRREKEPLLTHPTITGLQKVHDEWQREQTTQKAMLHVHLAAAVERLEWLEKKCEEQEKEIGDLKGKLDWSERDRDRLKGILQEKRAAVAQRD